MGSFPHKTVMIELCVCVRQREKQRSYLITVRFSDTHPTLLLSNEQYDTDLIYLSFSSFHRISGWLNVRILNSTFPFSPMDQRDIKALNCPSSGPAGSRTESKGGERDKTNPMSVILNAVCRGTANHVWMQRTEKQSIIAQAECKY